MISQMWDEILYLPFFFLQLPVKSTICLCLACETPNIIQTIYLEDFSSVEMVFVCKSLLWNHTVAKASEKFSGIFFFSPTFFLRQTELHIKPPMISEKNNQPRKQTSEAELVFTGAVEYLVVYFLIA